MTSPEHLPQPIDSDETALVEHTYALPGSNLPDLTSRDVMGAYLMSRLTRQEEPRSRFGLVEVGMTHPTLQREIIGYTQSKTLEREGWLVSPKIAAAIYIGTLAISVLNPALDDIKDEFKQIDYEIGQLFSNDTADLWSRLRADPQPAKVRTISVEGKASNERGSNEVDQKSLTDFTDAIARVTKKGGKVISIEVVGRSSDEYGTNASIGKPEQGNEDIAASRADSYKEALRSSNITKHGRIITGSNQDILTEREQRRFSAAAREAGFTGPENLIEAIESVNSGNASSSELTRLVNTLFRSKRGVTLTAKVTAQEEPGVALRLVEPPQIAADVPPTDPDREYDPWLIPIIPPLPKLRRKDGPIRPIKRLRIGMSEKIYRPIIVKEEVEQTWLRVRPEVVNTDGTLREHPWAYTQKYEHLLRDDRIADVLRADFVNPQGEHKSIRAMFIDVSPAEETIAEFEELLTKFTAMQDGKIADRVSAIFVYPSENSGTQHRDPKRISIGIDKQSGQSVSGSYTAVLDLVEMDMPTTWDAAEIHELFSSFEGPGWTVAHEVAGHATDDSDTALKLRKVKLADIPNAHIVQGDSRANKIRRLGKKFRPLDSSAKNFDTQFESSYTVVDLDGNMTNVKTIVDQNDSRLHHAQSATIVDRLPTQYAKTNDSEHYAETAAAVTTGIEIPFSEAGIVIPQQRSVTGALARFAIGYRPDTKAQQLFTDSIGAKTGEFPVSFKQRPAVSIRHIAPGNDSVIREHSRRSRTASVPKPEELVAILARVTKKRTRSR